jgi:hypothetical protein
VRERLGHHACPAGTEVLIPGEDDQVGGGFMPDRDYVVRGDTQATDKPDAFVRGCDVAGWTCRTSISKRRR